MNQDDIIRMAREAGFHCYNGCADGIDADLERFFQAAYAAGAVAEREACAKVAENRWLNKANCTAEEMYELQKQSIATAIRARGQK